MSNHLDEMKHFTIHEYEFNLLPKSIQKAFKQYENFEWDHLKAEQDRPAAFKKLVKEYLKVIKKNKGEESNEECHVVEQMVYLLDHMMACDFRKLNLDKLLK